MLIQNLDLYIKYKLLIINNIKIEGGIIKCEVTWPWVFCGRGDTPSYVAEPIAKFALST